jgi:hypothetical protein
VQPGAARGSKCMKKHWFLYEKLKLGSRNNEKTVFV